MRTPRSLASRGALLAAALVLGLAAPAGAAIRSLWIVHTTDFHGAVLGGAKDRASNRPIGGSAVLAAHVNRVRAEYPGAVLLLDGGDAFQGTAISNLVRGRSVVDVMNAMGYDAMAVGNHEFDWGLDTLFARMLQARFPFLSANIYERAVGERASWVKPYAIIERAGVKIGVIGITTPSAAYTTLPGNVAHLEFRDPTDIVNAIVPEVRAAGAEIVVVLAHEGGQQRRDGSVEGPIAAIAKGAAGVDGVFGGHSHTWVSGRVGGRPVIISSSNGRALGVMRLDWDDAAKMVVGAEPTVETAFADSIAPDSNVAAVVAEYEKAIGPAMARVVATAAKNLERGSPEQPLGILIADVIRRAAGTDFAMQNPGGVRTDIAAGPITVAKVYELMPFDNLILKYSLSGGQVKRILEDGLAYGRAMQISGLKFTYEPGRPEGNRITSLVLASGAPLDTTDTYTLATNDFLAGGGDGMETLKSIADYTNTNELVRDEILAWFEEETAAGRPIVPPEPGRIKEEEAK